MTDAEKKAALQRCIIHHMKNKGLSYFEAKKKCEGTGANFEDSTHKALRDAKRMIDTLSKRPTKRKTAKDAFMPKCLNAYRNTEGIKSENRGNEYAFCSTWFSDSERNGSLNEIVSLTLAQTEDEIRSRNTKVRSNIPSISTAKDYYKLYGDRLV